MSQLLHNRGKNPQNVGIEIGITTRFLKLSVLTPFILDGEGGESKSTRNTIYKFLLSPHRGLRTEFFRKSYSGYSFLTNHYGK
jgi:hypothetical protein